MPMNRVLNRKAFLAIGLIVALVALSATCGATQWIPKVGKYPAIRYCNSELSTNIRGFVDYIDFQAVSAIDASVYVYFKASPGSASWSKSQQVANFIRSKKEWTGDRSSNSVTTEIFVHWGGDTARPYLMSNPLTAALYKKFVGNIFRLSPVRPAHIQYFYAGLGRNDFWKYL